MSYWSVVQTETCREQVAANFLKQEKFDVYLPQIAGKRKRILPLFPSYLFVQIIDHWYTIRWTIGVLRVLSNCDESGQLAHPARIPDATIEALQRLHGRDGLIRLPKARGFQQGDPVRLLHGSLAGHLAIYDGMSGAERARVLLDMLGRKVPVVVATTSIAAAPEASMACV